MCSLKVVFPLPLSHFHSVSDLLLSLLFSVYLVVARSLSLSLCVCFRPLWVEYPEEPATFSIEDEYLIGEKLEKVS